MGMANVAEARAAAAPSAATSETAPPAVDDASAAGEAEVAGTHGESETSEEKALRLRSNSEETALILTSMMSMSNPPKSGKAKAATRSHGGSDDDGHSDMGEDMSGDDDMDDEYSGTGKAKSRVHQVNFEGPTGSKLDFTDDAGFNHRFRNESNRVKSLVTKHISIDELREHFDRPIIDVAKDFGICITLMKKICRRNGIKRWPHRQIRSLSKSIASMEAAMLSSQGPEREKYRDQILSLKLKRDSVIADPNKENSMTRPKTPVKDSSMRPHSHVHAAPKLSPRSGSPTSTMASVGLAKADGQSQAKGGRWTSEEHAAFLHGIRLYGKDWRRVAQVVRTRSAVQTRTHAQKYLLKFAGRFPFDADGMDLKQEQDALSHRGHEDDVAEELPSTNGKEKEKETDGGDTASLSSSSHEEEIAAVLSSGPLSSNILVSAGDAADSSSSALETMAMILNSPQFGSFRRKAPAPIQTQPSDPPSARDDVVMESPRGVPSTLPLLPAFVIKPSEWSSQASDLKPASDDVDQHSVAP